MASAPFIVAGPLRSSSGLGKAARLVHDALSVGGFDVRGIDLGTFLMQPEVVTDFIYRDARPHAGPGTILLQVNGPLVPMALTALGRKFLRAKYIIGLWNWELPLLPADWLQAIPFLHEIWVPSRFTARAIASSAREARVHVVHLPMATRSSRRSRPPASRPFTALCMFDMASSFNRKNPLAAIAAFKEAFGDSADARLIIKTSNVSRYLRGAELIVQAIGAAQNVELINQECSDVEIDALYERTDVVISLHRSEGFGLVVAEAMLRAIPVIATDWSATSEFLDSETGLPVPFKLIPARDPQNTYEFPDMMWAEPDVTSAAFALRALHDQPSLRKSLGEGAQQRIHRQFSPESFLSSVTARTSGNPLT